MPQVALIDYKVGNIFSMKNALEKAGFNVEVTSEPSKILNAGAIVLPGVGAFGIAVKNIAPLKPTIRESLEQGTLLMGSCLGMQLLFDYSEEGPGDGLSLLGGGVVRFREDVKIPHMGWNTLKVIRWSELLEGIGEGSHFYFVHSYYADPVDPGVTVAQTNYGLDFPSVVARGNLYGTQFHPEKSGKSGAALLRNFASIVER